MEDKEHSYPRIVREWLLSWQDETLRQYGKTSTSLTQFDSQPFYLTRYSTNLIQNFNRGLL